MTSDVGAPATGREGFTLVEVLVAMVILAIGLLALEALGIGAARAVARADVQSEYTALATQQMEETLMRVRQGQTVPTTPQVVGTAKVTTIVVPVDVVANSRREYTVTVTVDPPANPHLKLQPVILVAREIRPIVAP